MRDYMRVGDIKAAFNCYYYRYQYRNNIKWPHQKINWFIRNYFSTDIIKLNGFIACFENKQDHELTPEEECVLLKILFTYNLLNYDDFKALVYKTNLYKKTQFYYHGYNFINTVQRLITADLFTAINIDACAINCEKYRSIPSLALSKLIEAKIATQENFDLIMMNDACYMADIIVSLHKVHILTSENKSALINFKGGGWDFFNFHETIKLLKRRNFLTQKNFDQALKYCALLKPTSLTSIYLIRVRNFGQEVFDDIFDLCKQANGNVGAASAAIIKYCESIARRNNTVVNQKIFTDSQNTHTVSVNKSASASAVNLMKSYGQVINNPKEIIAEIAEWLYSLSHQDFKIYFANQLSELLVNLEKPFIESNRRIDFLLLFSLVKKSIFEISKWPNIPSPDIKIEAAKRAIMRLKRSQNVFIDPASRITIEQLLALIWKAIHDEKKRQGQLEDVKILLLNGLYGLQRDGNLNEKNIDHGGRDKFNCLAGAFNKLIESINGCHPDIEIRFITRGSATLKLPYVVKDEILKYLSQLLSSSSPTALGEVKRVAKRLKEDDVESLWEIIRPNVKERMFEEFGSIFSDDKDNPFFQSFIECGKDISLENFPDLAKKISELTNNDSQRFTLFHKKDSTIEESMEQLSASFSPQ